MFTIVLEFRCPRNTCCTNGRGSCVACLASLTARRLRNISCICMAAKWCSRSSSSLSWVLLPTTTTHAMQHHSTAIFHVTSKQACLSKQTPKELNSSLRKQSNLHTFTQNHQANAGKNRKYWWLRWFLDNCYFSQHKSFGFTLQCYGAVVGRQEGYAACKVWLQQYP